MCYCSKMKRFICSLFAIIVLNACSGSDGSGVSKDDNFTSAREIRDALVIKGVVCADYKGTAVADRDIYTQSAVDVASCDIEGENIEFEVWKDNGQRDNFTGMIKGMGCTMAKGFGISSFDYVKGDKWTIGGGTQTLTEKLAKTLDAEAVHIKC